MECARSAYGHAVLGGSEPGEQLGLGLHAVGDAVEHVGALLRSHTAPRAFLMGGLRGSNRRVGVLDSTERHPRSDLTGRG